jgi:hypothetical protein
MELFDRYLQAVKFWLPKAQKQDYRCGTLGGHPVTD